jgi:hypothetical protein
VQRLHHLLWRSDCLAQGLGGGRPDGKFPVEILWATLRNARLVFGMQSKWAKACRLRHMASTSICCLWLATSRTVLERYRSDGVRA